MKPDDITDEEMWRLVHLKWTVPCPRCDAAPGQPCLTANGYPTTHRARKLAALREVARREA